jgi:hypothetical protein
MAGSATASTIAPTSPMTQMDSARLSVRSVVDETYNMTLL